MSQSRTSKRHLTTIVSANPLASEDLKEEDIPNTYDIDRANRHPPYDWKVRRGDAVLIPTNYSCLGPRVGLAWGFNDPTGWNQPGPDNETFQYITAYNWDLLLKNFLGMTDEFPPRSFIYNHRARRRVHPANVDLLIQPYRNLYGALQQHLPPREDRESIDLHSRY